MDKKLFLSAILIFLIIFIFLNFFTFLDIFSSLYTSLYVFVVLILLTYSSETLVKSVKLLMENKKLLLPFILTPILMFLVGGLIITLLYFWFIKINFEFVPIVNVFSVGMNIWIGGIIVSITTILALQSIYHLSLAIFASMVEDILIFRRNPSYLRGIKRYLKNFLEIFKCEIVSFIAWIITILTIAHTEKKLPKFAARIVKFLVGIANVVTQSLISISIVFIILKGVKFKNGFKLASKFLLREFPTLASVNLLFLGFFMLIGLITAPIFFLPVQDIIIFFALIGSFMSIIFFGFFLESILQSAIIIKMYEDRWIKKSLR